MKNIGLNPVLRLSLGGFLERKSSTISLFKSNKADGPHLVGPNDRVFSAQNKASFCWVQVHKFDNNIAQLPRPNWWVVLIT